MSRLAIVQALEACEVGDYRLCVDILLTALEEIDEPVVIRCHCEVCGQGFEWPGLLSTHRLHMHPDWPERRAA